MLIGVPAVSSAATMFNPVLAAKQTSGTQAGRQAAPSPSLPLRARSVTAASSSARAPDRAEAGGGSNAAGGAASAASILAKDFATVYTATIAGKLYSGSVSKSDGDYVASVPSVTGAIASGSSQQLAENNLNTRIDAIV